MDDPEAFLRPALDWVARYLGSVRDLPVAAEVSPGELVRALAAGPPAGPEELATILEDLDRVVLPAVTLSVPADGAHYAQDASVPAAYKCSEGGITSPIERGVSVVAFSARSGTGPIVETI